MVSSFKVMVRLVRNENWLSHLQSYLFQDDFISRFYPSQLGSNIGSRICSRIASPLASMTASPVLPSSPILSRRALRLVSDNQIPISHHSNTDELRLSSTDIQSFRIDRHNIIIQ